MDISEASRLLSEGEHQALDDFLSLPLVIRKYYVVKAKYLHMSQNWIALAIAVAVILVGVASAVFGISPLISTAMIVLGVIIGVIAVWEMERHR